MTKKSSKDSSLDGLNKQAAGRAETAENKPVVTENIKQPETIIKQYEINKLIEHESNIKFFNPLEGDDYERLKSDIKKNGIHDALIVSSESNEKRVVYAGHNRLRAARELGIDKVPIREMVFIDEEQQTDFIIRDNLHRRHLSREEKQRLIDYFLKADSSQSDRAIADKTKTDKNTVKARRDKLQSGGEIHHHETRTGKDGKKQPARKAPVKPLNKTPETYKKKSKGIEDLIRTHPKLRSELNNYILNSNLGKYESYGIENENDAKKLIIEYIQKMEVG